MPKKLLLHIGYPKTATTTLQEGLFLKLHLQGKINYLGRTVSSTHTKSGISNFPGHDLVVDIRKKFLFGRPLPEVGSFFSDTLLNILSDEDLTIHPMFHKAQFGLERNPLEFVPELKNILKELDEVVVLMSVRNQADLIYSCFRQKYRFIHERMDGISFHDFIEKEDNILNTFQFNKVATLYKNAFNAKVHILLFEDFLNNRELYLKQLGLLLDVPTEDLNNLLGNEHFRNKKGSGAAQKVNVERPAGFGKLISLLKGDTYFKNFMARNWYMKNSYLIGRARKFLVKDVKIDFPVLLQEDKVKIKELFHESNVEFMNEFQMNESVMRKYNYIN